MTKMKNKDDRDFFQCKVESLEFSRDGLQSQVESGIITPDKYLADVKRYKVKVTKLLGQAQQQTGAKSTHVYRIVKRLELINEEITGME